MRFIHSLLCILLITGFITFTNALVVVDSTLASACVYYLNTFDWGCGGHGNGMKLYKCRCAKVDWLGSVTNCISQESNSTRLINHAYRHLNGRCLSKGGFHYTVEDMYAWRDNATQYLQDPTEQDHTVGLTHPLRTNTSEWEYYHKSFKDFAFEVEKSQWFGWGLVFYWSSIMFVATLLNFNRKYLGWKLFNDSNFWRRHISLPSISKKITNNEQIYWFWKFIPLQFPTRIETVIIIVFIIQVCITSSVGYTLSLPNAFINNRWYMNLDLISYRTDLMSISLFPIIFLFGIRNNPFIPLTGISFSTFNVYHKWNAIVMVVLAFIHSIIWTVDAIKDGGYRTWVVDAYFQWGIAATVISFLLIFHSEKVIRDLLYEIFLIFHKLFNIFFIITMYYHCNTLGWLGWIWSMAGIMVYDRFLRICRVILSGGIQNTKMTRCENDVIKLVLNKPKLLNYSLGSFAYIYFMNPWYMCWQSHPFTVCASPLEGENGKLVIYFKAKKGITARLLRKLSKAENQEMDIKIMVEGPYGSSVINNHTLFNKDQSVKKYVGISGGLGVVSIFPHFVELLKNQSVVDVKTEKILTSGGKSSTESSSTLENLTSSSPCPVSNNHKIYWVINDLTNILWFHEELKWLSIRGCEIIVIFTGSDAKLNEEKVSDSDLSGVIQDSGIKIVNASRRPDFYQYLTSEYRSCCDIGQDMECIACGPSSFNDDLRAAVVKVLNENANANSDLEYHVESFTW